MEMCGGESCTPAYRHFCCHGKVWDQILEFAKEWGRRPAGTQPDGAWGLDYWGEQFPHDYRLGDVGKIITAEDGKSLAEALERAMEKRIQLRAIDGPVLIVEGMDAQEYRMANAPLSVDLLNAFIRFALKGDFTFLF